MSDAVVASDHPGGPAVSRGGRKKLIYILLAAVLVAGGAGAWLLVKPAAGDDKAAGHGEVKKLPALYHAMEPPFVVNFENGGNARFLQIAVQLMTRNLKTEEELKANDPAIRNDLLLLFGSQSVESVASLEGKEKLRAATLETVRKIIKAEGGDPETVEAAYFTSFVMQ